MAAGTITGMTAAEDLVTALRAEFVELDAKCGELQNGDTAAYEAAWDERMAVVLKLDQARQAVRAERDEAAEA